MKDPAGNGEEFPEEHVALVGAGELQTRTPTRPYELAFGVGCFHFALRRTPPFLFSKGEYVAALRGALEKIPNVNHVEIDEGPDEKDFEVSALPPALEEGGVFPHPKFLEFHFDVYIPARIQDELLAGVGSPSTHTEHFRVHQHYAFESPVTYVELLRPSAFATPSTAVQVVREFLQKEMGEAAPISFECMGPSPFHADFYVAQAETISDAEWPFAIEHLQLRGYDDLRFTFGTDDFGSVEEARDHLFQELDHELGFFYGVVQARNQVYQAWGHVESSVTDLVDESAQQGWGKRLHRHLTHGTRARRTHTALVRLEAMSLIRKNALDQGLRHLYSTDEASYLEHYVSNEVSGWPMLPTEQLGKLVRAVEERRSRAVEFAVVLLAAIVGGIVGAWASAG